MLDIIKKKNKKVLITIDEVDNSEQMKIFVQAYQSLIRAKYPVLLLMTGLYENISKLQEDKSLTFLYRAPKINLEALNLKAIEISYKNQLNISSDLAHEMAIITKGYAYAYQVLGYLFYNNNSKNITEMLINEFDQYLAEYVYDKIYFELTSKEKEILLAMDSNNEVAIKDICEKTNLNIKYISVYRDRLIKRGLIISKTYGNVEFTLPRFNEYLKSQNF